MIIADSLTKAMQSFTNPSNESSDDVVFKNINIGQTGGVDVFFVLDVSGSITASQFESLKELTFALTSKVSEFCHIIIYHGKVTKEE